MLGTDGHALSDAIYDGSPEHMLFGFYYGEWLLIRKAGLWGIVRNDGHETTPFIYPTPEEAWQSMNPCVGRYFLRLFQENDWKVMEKPTLFPYEADSKWGYADHDAVVVPAQFDYAGEFEEGLACAYTMTDARMELQPMDLMGNALEATDLEETLRQISWVYAHTAWYQVNEKGEVTSLERGSLTAPPFFRKGVAVHEIKVKGIRGYFVVYVNAYGEVLRILNNEMPDFPSRTPECPAFDAWDLWDTYQNPVFIVLE